MVAPDWSADWLHRESEAWLDLRARSQFNKGFVELSAGEQAKLKAELQPDIRSNRFDIATGRLTISDERAKAITSAAGHYESVFSSDPAGAALRETYAHVFEALKTPTPPKA